MIIANLFLDDLIDDDEVLNSSLLEICYQEQKWGSFDDYHELERLRIKSSVSLAKFLALE